MPAAFILRVYALFACVLSRCFAQLHKDEGSLGDVMVEESPLCTCDCCMVTETLPADQQKISDDQIVAHTCAPSSEDTEQCPSHCQTSPTEEVLAAAIEPIDYERYCTYKCKPTMATAGTVCIRLTMQESAAAETSDGNGKKGGLPEKIITYDIMTGEKILPNISDDSYVGGGKTIRNAPWGEEADEREEEEDRDADKWADEEVATRELTIDNRRVIAERFRSETGSAVAFGAAAAERVRVDLNIIGRRSALISEVKKAIEPIEQGIDMARNQAETAALDAEKAEGETKQMYTQALVFNKTVGPTTQQLTEIMINQEAQKAADEEAEAYGHRFGWDKPFADPSVNAKIAANTASLPYMKEAVTMSTRMSQYEAASEALVKQVRALQHQAAVAAPEADVLEAHGDLVGAVTERHKIQTLLKRSREIVQDAIKYKGVAEQARQGVPLWQSAAYNAAAYAAQKYRESIENPEPN